MTNEKKCEWHAENIYQISDSPAPEAWRKIPLIAEAKPKIRNAEISLQQFNGTNICMWYVRKSALWNPASDAFVVTEHDCKPPSSVQEEVKEPFVCEKGEKHCGCGEHCLEEHPKPEQVDEGWRYVVEKFISKCCNPIYAGATNDLLNGIEALLTQARQEARRETLNRCQSEHDKYCGSPVDWLKSAKAKLLNKTP